ncbi:divisome protein SepX/GlpR [Nonomuraea dietziae]|uniref:divisome protein SepX/GlpR n=1 Tax=Nonomuraea dietziae TaxID=65515 RepID=UPI0033F07C11
MSSVLLYLAIVVMWLCVLVPMWLRRDRSNLAELEEFYAAEVTGPVPVLSVATPAEPQEVAEPVETDYAPLSDDTLSELNRQSVDLRRLKGRRRAIIVARRRRMLFFSILLVLASVVTAAVQVIPWWGVAPAGVLMTGYLTVLRMAVRVDRERRQRAVEARAARLRRLRERQRAEALAAEQAEAEILEFRQPDVLFDQYADPPRRAVGD